MNFRNKIFISLFSAGILFGATLQEAFEAAEPGNGYDKYISLDSDIIYTGGIGVFEGDVMIAGNGAVIDLEDGTGIWVYGDEYYPASLDVEYCTIIYGAYSAVSYGGTSTGSLNNINFVRNDFGVKLYDFTHVEIRNCNFVENTTYGLGIYSTTPTCDINYCNAWDNGEAAWMENCPG